MVYQPLRLFSHTYRTTTLASSRILHVSPRRLHSTPNVAQHTKTLPPKRRLLTVTSLSLGFAASTLALAPIYLHGEHDVQTSPESQKSLPALLRSYLVYSICSVPPIVQHAPAMISFMNAIPGVKQIMEVVIRITFFDQFVGGDTAEDTLPLLEQLRKQNKGILFGYSVEVDESKAQSKDSLSPRGLPTHKKNVKEMIHSIDVAGDFEDHHQQLSGGREQPMEGRTTWVAIKLSALLPNSHALAEFSNHLLATRSRDRLVHYPGTPEPQDMDILGRENPPAGSPLSQNDLDDLKDLYHDVMEICKRAKERNVKIIIDAEYTWYQPAIDAFQLSLMRQFNHLPKLSVPGSKERQTVQPLVYGTFQAYLRRNTMHLLKTLEDAQREGYAVGVKLVRGAYHDQEVKRNAPYEPNVKAIEAQLEKLPERFPAHTYGATPPVWSQKADTDENYNAMAAVLVNKLKDPKTEIGLLFGTHNGASCDHIIRKLIDNGLATPILGEPKGSSEGKAKLSEAVIGRLTFGQLYGMRDALTEYLTASLESSSPVVLKYVPYGALSDVIPYLSRRAVENQSVLGASEGGAADERRRAGAEIWKRIFG